MSENEVTENTPLGVYEKYSSIIRQLHSQYRATQLVGKFFYVSDSEYELLKDYLLGERLHDHNVSTEQSIGRLCILNMIAIPSRLKGDYKNV